MNIEKLITETPGQPDPTSSAWIVGDDREAIVTDPVRQPDRIMLAIGGQKIRAVLLTHGHWDHVTAVLTFVALMDGPPVHLNPVDEPLWRETHPHETSRPITDGDKFTVAGVTSRAAVASGYIPSAMCFVADGVVFISDTLFEDGPGATRWDHLDFDRIIASIRERLFTLPDDTVVNTGRGPSTTIGKERPHLDEWIARGQ